MKRVYFTRAGMDQFHQKLLEDKKKLKALYSRLSELADVGGDGYHDNFSYENQMREISMLSGQIVRQESLLSCCLVIDPPKKKNQVAIGINVLLEQNGHEEQWLVVGHGESDPDSNKIAYDTPLAQVLMGKKKDDLAVFRGSNILIKQLS